MISSICSVPIDKRIVFGWIPTSANSSSVNCECVVVAGWITNDLTSATLANNEKISRWSINWCASFSPPLILNVKIDPPPLGKYFSYNAWSGWSGNDGWFTFSTNGCLDKYSTTFFVFSLWRSILNDNVSVPCNNKKALNGEIVAPVSLNKMALIYVAKAAGPAASVNFTPW